MDNLKHPDQSQVEMIGHLKTLIDGLIHQMYSNPFPHGKYELVRPKPEPGIIKHQFRNVYPNDIGEEVIKLISDEETARVVDKQLEGWRLRSLCCGYPYPQILYSLGRKVGENLPPPPQKPLEISPKLKGKDMGQLLSALSNKLYIDPSYIDPSPDQAIPIKIEEWIRLARVHDDLLGVDVVEIVDAILEKIRTANLKEIEKIEEQILSSINLDKIFGELYLRFCYRVSDRI